MAIRSPIPHFPVLATVVASLVALAGCSTAAPSTSGAGGGFVSDNPGLPGGGFGEVAATGSGGGEDAAANDDANRAIAEADIIQVEGNRLYALSQYSGLSIIDISQANALTLVGRYSMGGVPFEMYLRDGVAYAMFSSWWSVVHDAATDAYTWQQTSHIEAIDVSDPADPIKIGTFDLPGSIADSRIVGDVLYAVSYEDGYCWNCQDTPNTTITSLAVGDPADISIVDKLTYTTPDPNGYGYWRRSVSVTTDRMYVAGIEWDGNGEGHSTIQIVDISDPTGELVKGASVEAAGQIESRWQMDEHEGILRVISQPGVWWSNGVPRVQTFTVTSSQQITPLAALDLTLPKPERLRSVRFDGVKAYAITAEQTDPLFTIDLTNPAQPAQLGVLEMPGWIYHMEPRGDRVFALGFDNADPKGSLNVSIFDVSNLAQPALLSRVPFGGDWSNLSEDQDRIHKAFKIDETLGAIFVPYSGWANEGSSGCGAYESGIQIIDFTQDALTLRGVAEARGQSRRAFMHGSRLYSVSDAEVAAFDIADRDAPVETARLALSTNVTQSKVAGNVVVRLSNDWWSGQAQIDVVPAADPGRAQPLGTLDLSSLSGDGLCSGYGYYGNQMFTHGKMVYLLLSGGYYDEGGGGPETLIATIDVSNPAAPTLKGQIKLPFDASSYGWQAGVISSGSNVVQRGSALVFRRTSSPDYQSPSASELAWLEIVNLANPASPKHVATHPLPSGLGHTQLLLDGTNVLTSHWEPVPGDPGKVRFYVDRVSIANPAAPVTLPSVNVPGSLLAFDGPSNHALTVDYKRVTAPNVSWETCYQLFGWEAQFDGGVDGLTGTCKAVHRTFKLVAIAGAQASLLDASEVPDSSYIGQVWLGDDRVFAHMSGYYGGISEGDGAGGVGENAGPTVLAVGGMRAGALETASYQLDGMNYAYPVAVSGAKLVMSGYSPPSISVLDATEMDELAYEHVSDVPSYVYGVEVVNDRAYCAMGPYGLTVVDLD